MTRRRSTDLWGWLVALLLGVTVLSGCQSVSIGHSDLRMPDEPTAAPTPTQLSTFSLDRHTEIIGTMRTTRVRPDETLLDIARRYDLGYDEIVAANPGVDPWVPKPGLKVVLPTRFILPSAPRQGLVVNLAARRLFFYPPTRPGKPAVVITHPMAIGREGWHTPLVQTRIVAKQVNPSWRVPPSIRAEHAQNGETLPAVVPPGPDNPLGTRALRLGVPGYLIHGTNKPEGIGMRVSHGCLQLYPEDIEALFEQVPVKTSVNIVNQPYLVGRQQGAVYLEAHGDTKLDAPALAKAQQQVRQLLARLNPRSASAAVDPQRVKVILGALSGYPQPITAAPPADADASGLAEDDAKSLDAKARSADPS